jgi:hypothetical protein
MGAAVHAGHMEVFSVAYVSGSIARYVLCGVSRDVYRMCLTSKVLLSNVFIYFSELSDTEQSLTYPQKLLETVGTVVTDMESVMVEVAQLHSVEQPITAAIKNSLRLNRLNWLFTSPQINNRLYCERCQEKLYSLVVVIKKVMRL